MMSLALALLAQITAPLTPGAAPPLPHQIQTEPLRPPRTRPQQQQQPAVAAPVPSRLRICLEMTEQTPGDAQASASAWLAETHGADRARPGECLGVALSRQDRWAEATSAFLAARDAAADKAVRARLGAMAGNAAMARSDAATALTALDTARADAVGDAKLTGEIAVDRGRALVMLGRNAEAEAALAEARTAAPDDPQAWLFSATLSRRMDKLPEAQAQIEKAALLEPANPEIGLEAGVIAALAGSNEAARRSWQSVIAAAPGSDEAAKAKSYLAQLGPSAPRPAAKPAGPPR